MKKLLSLSLFFCLCVSAAFAQGTRYDGIVLLDTGRPASGASVKVCSTGSTGNPCSPAATVYNDIGLTSPLAGSTASTDSHGNFFFYAPCGRYDLSFFGSGLTGYVQQNVQIGPCNAGVDKAQIGQLAGRVWVGSASYPATQPGIQQALTDACNQTIVTGGPTGAEGTDLYIPPLSMVLNHTTGQQFLVPCNLHIHGAGDYSTLFVADSSVPNSVPFFRFQPDNVGDQSDILVEGIQINGGGHGGHAFLFDGTNANITGPNNFVLRKNLVTGLPSGSHAVAYVGNGSVTPQMGWSIIENNTFDSGGIIMNSAVTDSNLITHNIFGSTNGDPCVDATTGSGASHETITFNNGGCDGGEVISTGGTWGLKILYNQFEQPALSTEANSAMIDLQCATIRCLQPEIRGNNFGSTNFASVNIRLDKVDVPIVYGNNVGLKTSSPGGTGIVLTSNVTFPFFGNDNNFIGTGTNGAVNVTNSTSANPYAVQLPTKTGTLPASISNDTAGGILFCTNAGKCWSIGNAGTLFSPPGNGFALNGIASGFTQAVSQSNAGGIFTPLAMNSGSVVKLQVASDFTTTSTSLATITGLTFTQLANATNYSFHCELAYSQATAAAANAFGIQVATNAPTNVFATGKVWTSATAATSGVLATLATTTATNIVTFTPSATATNFVAELSGTIELPASANTVNFMALTGSASDALTIKRGSYCQVW